MLKTTLMTTVLLATMMAAATPASAYGACFAVCAEATVHTETTTITNTRVDPQVCAGNLVIQIGVSNEAHLCSREGPGSGSEEPDPLRDPLAPIGWDIIRPEGLLR